MANFKEEIAAVLQYFQARKSTVRRRLAKVRDLSFEYHRRILHLPFFSVSALRSVCLLLFTFILVAALSAYNLQCAVFFLELLFGYEDFSSVLTVKGGDIAHLFHPVERLPGTIIPD